MDGGWPTNLAAGCRILDWDVAGDGLGLLSVGLGVGFWGGSTG